MGEYAIRKSDGREIKIGTCEQMYYLRADQVGQVRWKSGNVDPTKQDEAERIRFRFPFPQEDNIKPGDFEDHDYGLGISSILPPEDIDHGTLQFSRNYPTAHGIGLSTPCPRSKEGKASGFKFFYNGYSGPVQVHSQRLVDGKLVLILRCADCGALYRVPTLEEAAPVLKALREEHTMDKTLQKYYCQVADRIEAGYTAPNFWTPAGNPTEETANAVEAGMFGDY